MIGIDDHLEWKSNSWFLIKKTHGSLTVGCRDIVHDNRWFQSMWCSGDGYDQEGFVVLREMHMGFLISKLPLVTQGENSCVGVYTIGAWL